jgi:hypothetical protein
MRWTLIAGFVGIIVSVLPHSRSVHSQPSSPDQPKAPAVPPPLHSEQGLFATIKIEEEQEFQRPNFKDENGNNVYSARIVYHRMLVNNVLWGLQVAKMEKNAFDIFAALAVNPWDNLLMAGAVHAFDPRQEPLSYYHRSGPVGAIFHELRTRNGGADAKAPIAMLGLEIGTVAAYALKGQKLAFFETDPVFERLFATSDKYFTYVSDARRRGAVVDIHLGDRRTKLEEDKDSKYALILVDQSETWPVPKDVMTREAVQLYFDRLTNDGMVALHISNKSYDLEPMLARLAADLKLTARIWNDDERHFGKTASTWVILARKPENLGSLFSPIGDLIFASDTDPGKDDRKRQSMDGQLHQGLLSDYSRELTEGKPQAKYKTLNDAEDATKAWLDWIKNKVADEKDVKMKARLTLTSELIKKYGPFRTYGEVMISECGHAFRRLKSYEEISAWTDAYQDIGILSLN